MSSANLGGYFVVSPWGLMGRMMQAPCQFRNFGESKDRKCRMK